MKLNSNKSAILRPLLVGVIGLLTSLGLFVYYYFYSDNATMASYVVSGLIAVVGVFGILSTGYFGIIQIQKNKVVKLGESVVAEYILHDTKVSAAKENYYYIKYKYTLHGVEFEKTSKSEFVWKEVLTLKAVKKFNIKVLNNKVVLDCKLEDLFNENKDAVLEIEKRYNEAYKDVDNILNKK